MRIRGGAKEDKISAKFCTTVRPSRWVSRRSPNQESHGHTARRKDLS